jgi:hypothetical protein
MRLKRSCPREFQENRASERKHLRFRYCLQAWLRDGATIEGFSPRILAFEGTQKRGRRVCSELEKSKQKGHSRNAQRFRELVWRASCAAAEKAKNSRVVKNPGTERIP